MLFLSFTAGVPSKVDEIEAKTNHWNGNVKTLSWTGVKVLLQQIHDQRKPTNRQSEMITDLTQDTISTLGAMVKGFDGESVPVIFLVEGITRRACLSLIFASIIGVKPLRQSNFHWESEFSSSLTFEVNTSSPFTSLSQICTVDVHCKDVRK